MAKVKFDTTPEEMRLIAAIVDRGVAEKMIEPGNRLNVVMDLSATNANGTPLDFERLLAFPTFDFSHDLFGIDQHIDRATGQLTRCFLPRCAKPTR